MKSDNLSERLSLLVDDQLDTVSSLKTLEELERHRTDGEKFSRYLLVSEVLHSRRPVIHDSAFVARVHEALEHEPAILVPDWRKRLSDRAITLAMAATLTGLAVFVAGSVIEQREARPVAMAAVERAKSDQLHDYLMTHNETAYLAANGGLMPYLRVVSSDRSGR